MPQARFLLQGRHGAFYCLASRSKTAPFKLEFDTTDTAAAFTDDLSSICETLAVIEGFGVHQVMGLLVSSAATP